MIRVTLLHLPVGCLLLMTVAAVAAPPYEKGSLRAGAARVDITPPKDAALPMRGYAARTQGHQGIHDNLHVRAVVVDDGTSQGAIIACDLIGFSHDFWEEMSQRLARETEIPREQILLAGVHTHGAPSLRAVTDDPGQQRTAYLARVKDSIVEAVRQAKSNLRPARAGAGTGRANVSTNRRARMADGGWWLGVNPDGPSDKTVAVVRFETLSGEPIAIFSNYAVHGTVMGQENLQITGDLPGATARFVEEHYGNGVVAPWTSGAAGDQNAIYGPGNNFRHVAALGQILGEEVIRVAGEIKTSPRARIRGMQKVVTCPGQKLAPGVRPRDKDVRFIDADPVNIRLSLLMINNVALAGVSGEVLTMVGERLKKESPFSHTIMLTNCNGSSGYLPDDAAYEQVSYEITSARVKPGCAENAIVNGLLDMMDQF